MVLVGDAKQVRKSGQIEIGLTTLAATVLYCYYGCSTCRNLCNIFLILTVDCGTLTDPVNGQVNHTAGTTVGQTATYSCNTGYNLVGNSTRPCQATGNWSESAPTCQGIVLKPDVTLFICVCTQIHVNMYYLGLVWVQEHVVMSFSLQRSKVDEEHVTAKI